MYSSQDITQALIKAAQSQLGRQLTANEVSELIEIFNKYKNEQSAQNRVEKAFEEFNSSRLMNFSESVTASDNTDRAMQDLLNKLKNWKP